MGIKFQARVFLSASEGAYTAYPAFSRPGLHYEAPSNPPSGVLQVPPPASFAESTVCASARGLKRDVLHRYMHVSPGGGGGVLPYKGLMGTCGQPGYVFRDFCLKQGIEFIIFCLNQGIDFSIFVLNRISFLGR